MDMENNTVILSSTQTINISDMQKILRFGALRAVLRHYSRIINKQIKNAVFFILEEGSRPPLWGPGGVLGPLDPPPLDPPQARLA